MFMLKIFGLAWLSSVGVFKKIYNSNLADGLMTRPTLNFKNRFELGGDSTGSMWSESNTKSSMYFFNYMGSCDMILRQEKDGDN